MGEVKHLQNEEAVKKLKELAGDRTCHFCTFTGEYSINARPMATISVEDDGCIYFFSDKDSSKNHELQRQSKVQLLYGNPGSAEFLSIEGDAEIIEDRAAIAERFEPMVKAWFPEGKDDPSISLIKVQPANAYYWDTQHGKAISFLKIAAAMITGKTMDDGVEGRIDV